MPSRNPVSDQELRFWDGGPLSAHALSVCTGYRCGARLARVELRGSGSGIQVWARSEAPDTLNGNLLP